MDATKEQAMKEQDQGVEALSDLLFEKARGVFQAFGSLPVGTDIPRALLDTFWSWLNSYLANRRDFVDHCRTLAATFERQQRQSVPTEVVGALEELAESVEVMDETIKDAAQKAFLSGWVPKTQH